MPNYSKEATVETTEHPSCSVCGKLYPACSLPTCKREFEVGDEILHDDDWHYCNKEHRQQHISLEEQKKVDAEENYGKTKEQREEE